MELDYITENCSLITEQRMNGLLCRSMSCEPCQEFRQCQEDYLIRKTREQQDYKTIQDLEKKYKDACQRIRVLERSEVELLADMSGLRNKLDKAREALEFCYDNDIADIHDHIEATQKRANACLDEIGRE